MQLHIKTVRQGINKAYLKVTIKRANLDYFKEAGTIYLNYLDHAEGESEEHLKGYLKDFLSNTFYTSEEKLVNTSDRIDLAIYSGKTTSSSVDVIIEAKRPDNKSEMISRDKFNQKALHEALHYYFDEREQGNDGIKQVIITNYREFFIFDAQEFERHFYSHKKLLKTYRQWKNDEKVSGKTDFIYKKFKEFISESNAILNGVYLDLTKFKNLLAAPASEEEDKKLIPLYKLFSPEHLVKKSFANDSNYLDKRFYNEFLHILGLQEVREKGSRLIQRLPKEQRQVGSLIESTIGTLKYGQHMNEVRDAKVQYGTSEDDQLFGVALELVITWMNRILFLKLMEAQLLAYHQNDKKFKFLSYNSIDEYDELNKLFFWVLAIRNEDRPALVRERFGHIPYLNSSLFDATDLEKSTLQISGLDDKGVMDLYSRSILKKGVNPPRGSLNTLDYLLRFLDAYNFSAESSGGIQTEDKTLINASVLGLIFEKINGYKDGSFFTPGFITEYMARETLRKAVADKFWDYLHPESHPHPAGFEFEDLPSLIGHEVSYQEANEIINTITICDPAVGSGHFLVSCLNELIAIKSELRILSDHEGKRIPHLDIEVENDELAIEHEGELFEYKLNHEWRNEKVSRKPAGKERQRIQEALFHEKKFLIENCLFGVDINPNSVKICRLRLWIELLKHAYYRSDEDFDELEVLPNIDINIKQGNSLVSRFELDEDLSSIFKKSEHSLEDYKQAVRSYRETRDRNEKQRLQQLIDDIKAEYSERLLNNKPINKKLSRERGKLELMKNEDLFGQGKATKKDLKKQEKKVAKLEAQKAEEETGVFYREAFEWRFEFPEVLDEDGNYIGFDVVIGNPPYIRVQHLNRIDKTVVEYYKSRYKSGSKGNYDIYVLFVEHGLDLLNNRGVLNYILPHKFFNSNYGEPLREIISKRQSLKSIIHFQDIQIFEEASTYVCLLQLSKNNNEKFYVEYVADLDDWKSALNIENGYLDSSLATLNKWNFVVGKSSELFYRLDSYDKIGAFSDIFVGLQTSADTVLLFKESFKSSGATSKLYSNELDQNIEIENALLKEVVRSGKIGRYWATPNALVLFPYIKSEDSTKLIPQNVMKEKYPLTWDYLLKNKKKLENRESGKFKGEGWHQLYPKNLDEWTENKVLVPYMVQNLSAYPDDNSIYFVNVTTGGFGLRSKDQRFSNTFLTGILNSKLLDWFFKKISTNFRGGYFAANKQFLEQLPICDPNFKLFDEVEILVTSIINAKKVNSEADTSKLEAKIDQLVYELYGLSEEDIAIVEGEVG